jgi:ribulose-5-phosphate 4-epimerase/fuculose-1-phosphate aldolase
MTTHVRPEAFKDRTNPTRINLATAYRLLHRLGLDNSIYTHISVRLPGRHDRFLINRSACVSRR